MPEPLGDLSQYQRAIYSQSGEDGVIERIFRCIGERSRYFVEFGALDGLDRSNTAHLRLNRGWDGLLMDRRADDGGPVRNEWVTAENVESLFERYGVPAEFDLLSIDVDGNDYWLWRALSRYRARVVVVEYNLFFPADVAVTVPYDPERRWQGTTYHGASLGAFRKLGRERGYSLVWTDPWAPNAFFVRSDQLAAEDRERPVASVAHWEGWYQEPPDGTGDREWVAV